MSDVEAEQETAGDSGSWPSPNELAYGPATEAGTANQDAYETAGEPAPGAVEAFEDE